MYPRKKESKKWTKIPADFATQVKTVFEENFKAHLGDKKLTVEGRIYPTEIVLRVGVNQKGELRFQNFEVSLDHSKENAISQIHIGVDAIASLMLEYFEDEENHEMPLVWKEYPFEKQKIWLQYSSTNSELEEQANKLLGLKEDETLLTEEEQAEFNEDLADENLAENLDENADENIDMSQPQIFGGKKPKKDKLH